MRDKETNPVRIEGLCVVLEEIRPEYFDDVIRWRNDPKLNKYINQPFKLTRENEMAWYREHYLQEESQGLFMVLDKKTGKVFGTNGFTHYDSQRHQCVWGRLMAGEVEYQGSPYLIEGILRALEYMFYTLDCNRVYCHMAAANLASKRICERFGFAEHEGLAEYPELLTACGDNSMYELLATREAFAQAREKMLKFLQYAL